MLPKFTPAPQYEYDDNDRVTKVVVNVVEQKEMPQWQELEAQCPPIKAEWTRYYGVLEAHENKHLDIDKKHFTNVHQKLVGKKREAAWKALDDEIAAADAENQAYDTSSDHGINEGAKINAAVQCAPEKVKSTATPPSAAEESGLLGQVSSFFGGLFQAKLAVSQPGDPLEQEADAVAERIAQDVVGHPTRTPVTRVVRRVCAGPGRCDCAECEEEEERRQASLRGVVQRTVHPIARCAAPAACDCPDCSTHHAHEHSGSAGELSVQASERIGATVGSGGSSLDPDTRGFMEAQLGHDFSRVRIHTDGEAAASARMVQARAYTLGSNIVFASGQYAPGTTEGRRLLAHELTHVVQQGDSQALVLRDGPAPSAPSDSKTPVKDANTPDLVMALDLGEISRASTEDRMALIDVLLNAGSWNQKFRVPEIWDTFGAQIVAIANQNGGRWKRSFEAAAGQMRNSREVKGQRTYFLADVEDTARRYLDENDAFCRAEFQRLGLDENGGVLAGPPTAEQASLLKTMRDDASKIAANQEAMRDLRKIKVGYETVTLPPGGAGDPLADGPTSFDPEKRPNFPIPENEPNRKTWEEVKKVYDDLDMLVQARLAVNPTLFPLVRGAKEDPSKTGTVARGSQADALSTIGGGLRETRENIAKTRPMLKVIAEDLEPIHGQLLAGTVTVSNRNWKTSPFYEAVGRDIVEQNKPGPWWEQLGLMAAHMGVYVVAGLATGGTALAIGLAAKGVADVAISQARADVLESAAKTNVTEKTGLVRDGQVDEAKADVILTAAFAMLDFIAAAGAVRSAIKEIVHFEQEAAKAAAAARKAAAKLIAKEDARAEAEALAKQAREAAEEARASARKAEERALSATPEETNRAAAEAKKASQSAEEAETAAREAESLVKEAPGTRHPSQQVGEHKVTMRGDIPVRCTDCAELSAALKEQGKTLVAQLEAMTTGVESNVAADLRRRIKFAETRGANLCDRARRELPAAERANREALEKIYVAEGAIIEREMQAIERTITVEAGAAQGAKAIGKGWGEEVVKNVKERIAAIREAHGAKGKLDAKLEGELRLLEQDAKTLQQEAALLEQQPGLGTEGNIASKWREVDNRLRVEETKIEGQRIEWTPHAREGELPKHLAPPKVPWPDIVESTKTGPAKYRPEINIEALERRAWGEGTWVASGRSWKVMEFPDEIGASAGLPSKWIRVEESAGTIHGHPITQGEYSSLLTQK